MSADDRVSEGLVAAGLSGAARLLSPAGPRARLSILIYHRVLAAADPLLPDEPDAARFEREMRLLGRHFTVLPLREAVRRLREGTLPARPACVTFDDGYADNAEVAAPILRRLGVPATFFVATGYLDGGLMWNDRVIEAVRRCPGEALDLERLGLGMHPTGNPGERVRAIDALLRSLKHLAPGEREAMVEQVEAAAGSTRSPNPMMRSEQVAELHRTGFEIGGHTVTHPILQKLPAEAADREIRAGRERLEKITGAPVSLFAYPNGRPHRDYGAEHVRLVRDAGFEAAVSTAWGASTAASDPFQLPRFTPWKRDSTGFLAQLTRNLLRTAPDRV